MAKTIKTGDRVLIRNDAGAFEDCGAVVTSRKPREQSADVQYVWKGLAQNGRFGVYDLRRIPSKTRLAKGGDD